MPINDTINMLSLVTRAGKPSRSKLSPQENSMIIVTGATGKLGEAIVEGLLKNLSPDQIGVSVRDPQKAQELAERGIRVRQGDFSDPASLRHAFEGASQVLVVSVNALGPGAVEQHGNAIAAAKAAGAGRVLYTSHMAASPDSAFSPARDHAATEGLLQSSGMLFTSLRNGFYAESALWQLGSVKKTHKLALPEDGPVSWTSRSDLAEAAVVALTHPELLNGITPPLTNPKTLDFAAIAQVASEIIGRQITRETIADNAFRQLLLASGLPEPMADGVVGLFVASRQGEFAATDPTLERLLGRPAMPMQDFLERHLAPLP